MYPSEWKICGLSVYVLLKDKSAKTSTRPSLNMHNVRKNVIRAKFKKIVETIIIYNNLWFYIVFIFMSLIKWTVQCVAEKLHRRSNFHLVITHTRISWKFLFVAVTIFSNESKESWRWKESAFPCKWMIVKERAWKACAELDWFLPRFVVTSLVLSCIFIPRCFFHKHQVI